MQHVERPQSLTEQATESLKNAILAGDLVPGQLYTAGELGRQLNVSRTPIREALQELARRGLVEIEKNRGMRVRSTSVESLMDVFQVRLMLEVPLARRAVELGTAESRAAVESAYEMFGAAAETGDAEAVLRADRDFHRALLAGAGNDRARTLLQEQRDFVLSTGMGTVPHSRTAMECFEDHTDIMAAYRRRDAEAVGDAVARHIAHTAKMLIRQETRSRPEFAAVDADAAIDWLLH
ncbi:MAG: GntR family transcriptional regulator [Micrococcaceae bacterium]